MNPIICISDSHLGYRHRSKTKRLFDFRKSFEDALSKALELNPEVVIFGGDLLHHPKPDPVSMRALVKGLLDAAEKTQVVVIIGNHEIAGHLGTTYAPMYADLHENIHVLSTENPHLKLSVGDKTVGFHGFQFIRNRELAEKTLREVASVSPSSDFEILCLHQAVEGYLSPHEISRAALREVAPNFNLILCGHVHKRQRISEVFDVCPAYIIGSTERVSFNEWENPTGFMVFEDFDFTSPRYVEVSSASMRKVTLDAGSIAPTELNRLIESTIWENGGVSLLQVDVKADVSGDILDVKQNWQDTFTDYTILDVNVTPHSTEAEVMLESLELSSDTIREYFEKSGLTCQDELLDTCINLFEEFGR